MAKLCDLGIIQLVRQEVSDKPWYGYDEEKEPNFIEIKSSPRNKVNSHSFIGVANSTAQILNRNINKTVDIGTVFYAVLDYKGKVGVVIAPTDQQLKLLNANEDAERAQILAEEEESRYSFDVEHQIIEDKIRSGEIKQICEV